MFVAGAAAVIGAMLLIFEADAGGADENYRRGDVAAAIRWQQTDIGTAVLREAAEKKTRELAALAAARQAEEQRIAEAQRVAAEAELQRQVDEASYQTPVTPAPQQYAAPSGGGDAKANIYARESGNDPYAVNPSSGACGLCQALPCEKMGCALGDYACQDAWCDSYAMSRYGSWDNAWAFWLNNSWW